MVDITIQKCTIYIKWQQSSLMVRYQSNLKTTTWMEVIFAMRLKSLIAILSVLLGKPYQQVALWVYQYFHLTCAVFQTHLHKTSLISFTLNSRSRFLFLFYEGTHFLIQGKISSLGTSCFIKSRFIIIGRPSKA